MRKDAERKNIYIRISVGDRGELQPTFLASLGSRSGESSVISETPPLPLLIIWGWWVNISSDPRYKDRNKYL